MINEFLVFAWPDYEASGGVGSLVGSVDDINKSTELVDNHDDWCYLENIQVVQHSTMEVVMNGVRFGNDKGQWELINVKTEEVVRMNEPFIFVNVFDNLNVS
jgi:hypothetical protein